MEEDAAVMDGEGGEWSRFAGRGVVVDVVRSDLLWLGEEKRGTRIRWKRKGKRNWNWIGNIHINKGHCSSFQGIKILFYFILKIGWRWLPLPNPTSATGRSIISLYKENMSICVNLIKIWTTIIVFRGIS